MQKLTFVIHCTPLSPIYVYKPTYGDYRLWRPNYEDLILSRPNTGTPYYAYMYIDPIG